MELPALILASTSPYRAQLLGRLGLPFTAVPPKVDESPQPGEHPGLLCYRLAEAKARAVAGNHPGALIIGSDQLAVLGDRILTKPGSHARAEEQLSALSGHRVTFLTGLCLLNASSGQAQVDLVPYSVVFRELSPATIDAYLRRDQPYQCAGSFKSEGLGIALFERMEGEDPTALIGLPLIRLVDMLAQEGVAVLGA
jgi:septum formation protein